LDIEQFSVLAVAILKNKTIMAKDLFHDAVKRGLEKDQWTITNDPLELELEEITVKIDLAAERLIAAERGEEKIAVEIKSFIGTSAISDFHTALGQFLNYQIFLEINEPNRLLYLTSVRVKTV
jgi:hypothetical protein